jgi:hypothetical protein
MKLLRYGDKGQEKPGLLDAQGNIRDLSAHIADVAGTALSAANLAALGKIDPPACRWSAVRRASARVSARSASLSASV